MGKRDKKKKKEFKFFIRRYVFVLILLMIICIILVISSLIDYEKLQVNNYLGQTVQKLVEAGQRGKISDYIDTSKVSVSEFEDNNLSIDKGISELLKNGNVSYKLSENSTDLNNPVYNVCVNNDKILEIELNGEKKKTKLGILTVQEWQVRKINLVKSDGIYECEIVVPKVYNVYVNDKKLEEKDITENYANDNIKELAKYSDVDELVKYKISNLLKEPKVEIKDENGNSAEYKKENNKYSTEIKTEVIQDQEEAMKKLEGKVDPLAVAKDWSLYLSNDLSGKTHGFYNINQYLIKGSYMWDYAYKWATNVDITFVSNHKLDNPTFTNVKVSNFNIYSKNAFSCDVYLEKNLTLTKNGQKIKDTMNERMYFAHYKGEWKLVNMHSITKNNQ